ncbi:MAG: MBL fold metallo-hydrolase [Treponema sp.]|nr:MBL fold metallo-hydrolase [Treponema sp.]
MKMPIWPVAVSLCVLAHCASQPDFDEADWQERVSAQDSSLLYAPHRSGDGTYFNPWQQRVSHAGRRSWFFRRLSGPGIEFDSFSPEGYSLVPNDYSYLSDSGQESISFAGHASAIIKMDGETVFTDPFFSNGALIVRKKVKNKLDFSQVPRRPVTLISHNHYDHLDKYSVKKLIKKDAVFVVPLGLKGLLNKFGAKEVYELDWWESVAIGNINYTLLPAQHWSRRLGQDGGATLWGGFLLQGSKTVYFSGDTGYFAGFKEFGRLYDIDYALLGAGAYEPRWFMHYSHMNVAEFIRAAVDLNAKTAIPMHFGIISLSDEPLLYPLYETEKFIASHPEYGRRLRPLRAGEFIRMDYE